MRNGFLILSSKCSAVLCCISAKSLPGQRLFSAIFPSCFPRPQGSPYHVRDCAEDGAHDGGRERFGRAARKSGLRHALERAGGPPEGNGLYYAERFGSSSTNS